MKTFSKISIGLLSLLTLGIVSCKKDLVPASPIVKKLASPFSADYGKVKTLYFNLDYPGGPAIDGAGNLYITDNGAIVMLIRSPTDTIPIDGVGNHVTIVNNTNRIISKIVFGADSNLYLPAYRDNIILRVTRSGVVTTAAGMDGVPGFTNGPAAQATFNTPFGVRADAAGNIYISDAANFSMRVLTNCDNVTTLTGTGLAGFQNGPVATATFRGVSDIAIDHQGNMFIPDGGNNVIRKISTDGIVSTFAGSGTLASTDGKGTAASFYEPFRIVIDSQDNLYVADHGDERIIHTESIRKITPDGTVTTFAGDGINGFRGFSGLLDFAIDGSDNLYVCQGNKGEGNLYKIATK